MCNRSILCIYGICTGAYVHSCVCICVNILGFCFYNHSPLCLLSPELGLLSLASLPLVTLFILPEGWNYMWATITINLVQQIFMPLNHPFGPLSGVPLLNLQGTHATWIKFYLNHFINDPGFGVFYILFSLSVIALSVDPFMYLCQEKA